MAKPRSYRLLCPIARALDRVGDRWTLLILRDLFAGPARFSELQRGLTGIAANLLTERLDKLTRDGLIEKAEAAHGVTIYRLTELGRLAGPIVYELARFGARFGPETDVIEPGNLRTVATTLGLAARQVRMDDLRFRAQLVVDGDSIGIEVGPDDARVSFGPLSEPELAAVTTYTALLDVTDGSMDVAEFAADHLTLETLSDGAQRDFAEFMERIITALRDEPVA